MIVKQQLANTWYEYYTSRVNYFHVSRKTRHNGIDMEDNYKSLNIPKMITKELASYILAEVDYPSEIELSFNKLLTLTENTLAIGQILLIKKDVNSTNIDSFVPIDYDWSKENEEILIYLDNETT